MARRERTRSGLYIRVSTQQQVANGNSLTTQKSRLLSHAKARGYELHDVYVDAGLSGKNTKRPEFQRLLEDVRARRIDIVLVWKVDRISRSMKDLLDLVETLRDHGVDFAAVDQQFDTSSPAGLLSLHVLGSFAQFERELLIERTKEGTLQRLQRGDWSCGPAPLGYRKEDGCLLEVPAEVKVVRCIFRLFLKLKSRRGVARRLNEDGVLTRRGKLWCSNTVTNILRNPVYTGANVYGRHASGDTRLKDRSEWTVVPGVRKAMIDQGTFDAVQVMIEEGKAPPPSAPLEYPLSGKLRCEKCGSAMFGAARRKDGKVYRYYRCSGWQRFGPRACPGTTVPADAVEADTSAVVAPGVGTPTTPGHGEAAVDESVAAKRRYRIARLLELYEAGQIDKAALRLRLADPV